MSSNTSLHSNAFNFMSFFLSQVDPRTGQFTHAISLPELKANYLCGPVVPLQLFFNPLNNRDSGFGRGWNLQLSQFDPATGMLSLYTGESFKVLLGGELPVIPEKKLDSFHFHEQMHDGKPAYRVEHKSGLVEILQVRQGGLALPVQMRSAQSHHVTLEYESFGTDPLLGSIANADGSQLLSVVRRDTLLELTLHPGTAFEARFVLNILGGLTKSLVLPTDDQASWRFEYVPKDGLSCLEQVWTPTGGHEKVTYSGVSHSLPGLGDRKVPRVEKHVSAPGFQQPAIETHYEYDTSGANFLGYGSGVSWSDDGLDNLNKDGVARGYTYETNEILWDADIDQAIRKTHRVFNRAHLLILEETTQYSSEPQEDGTVHKTESKYYFDPDLDFADQKPYCQLPESVTQTWHYLGATVPRHEETTSTTYDDWGNQLSQKLPSGVTQTQEWYASTGELDEQGAVLCPPDPQGFVRNLKSTTVTPAASRFGDAPTLTTFNRYSAQLGLTGNGPWLAIRDESLVTEGDGKQQQLTSHQYINQPDNPFEHGRKLQETVTLNGKSTSTRYVYSKTRNPRDAEEVLQSENTLTGFDGEIKVVTVMHSMLNGQPLLSHDDNNVQIAYKYDRLSRVIKETVAPGTPYEASRSYTYTLTNAVGQQASQTACDVKGVTTTTWVDGLNRAIKEARHDADALGFNRADPPRPTYEAMFDNRGKLVTETLMDWEGAKNVPLESRFQYDNWGAQRCVIRPDGVEEHEHTDPVRLTTTQWLEVAGKDVTGKTVTTNNLFEKPVSVKRYLSGVDPAAPGAQPYSEEVKEYDGIGRAVEELDAARNKTTYTYDVFDRMVKTVLPDFTEVTREYAPHSSEDLPVTISVNEAVLGTQEFNGRGLMVKSTTGGRITEYFFDKGQTQPKSVLRPSGVETKYIYRPELGEDPERRIAHEGTARYVYDEHNARLLMTEEVDENDVTHVLERRYYSTGELKSELRSKTGDEQPYEMHYEYSRQSRLLKYRDVLGQTQTYIYNAKAQLTETRLGSTVATFGYDNLARVSSISTIDGEQSLVTHVEYDDFSRETKRTFDFGNGDTQTLSQHYDEVDRLTRRELEDGSQTLRAETYEYDPRGRLVYYTCVGDQCPVDPYGKIIQDQTFGFDDKDNITFLQTNFAGGSHSIYYEYDNPSDPCQLTGLTNELVPPRPGDPDYPPRIDFEYDPNGNLIKDELGRTLAYDSLSRLISVSERSGGAAGTFEYDALDALSAANSEGAQERRFYQGDDVATLVKGSASSSILRAVGSVLAEQLDGAGPKS